jgi:AcrR family transcriptional regulator
MNGGLLLVQVLKDEILGNIKQAAVDCFMSLGYEATSMREISRRANISVGNVYRYFPSKEALFDYAVEPAITLLKESQKQQPTQPYLFSM